MLRWPARFLLLIRPLRLQFLESWVSCHSTGVFLQHGFLFLLEWWIALLAVIILVVMGARHCVENAWQGGRPGLGASLWDQDKTAALSLRRTNKRFAKAVPHPLKDVALFSYSQSIRSIEDLLADPSFSAHTQSITLYALEFRVGWSLEEYAKEVVAGWLSYKVWTQQKESTDPIEWDGKQWDRAYEDYCYMTQDQRVREYSHQQS